MSSESAAQMAVKNLKEKKEKKKKKGAGRARLEKLAAVLVVVVGEVQHRALVAVLLRRHRLAARSGNAAADLLHLQLVLREPPGLARSEFDGSRA